MLSDPIERYSTLGMLSGALYFKPECFGVVYSSGDALSYMKEARETVNSQNSKQ